MNWRSTAWASDSLSWKDIFSILSVISQVLSFQLTHLWFSTGVTSPHGAHPSNTDTQVTCPAVHNRSPLTLFPSSSFGHFSPNTMQPSPSTSISPLGSISEGTNSRMMLIFQTNPYQTLLCHTCHLQCPASCPKPPQVPPQGSSWWQSSTQQEMMQNEEQGILTSLWSWQITSKKLQSALLIPWNNCQSRERHKLSKIQCTETGTFLLLSQWHTAFSTGSPHQNCRG